MEEFTVNICGGMYQCLAILTMTIRVLKFNRPKLELFLKSVTSNSNSLIATFKTSSPIRTAIGVVESEISDKADEYEQLLASRKIKYEDSEVFFQSLLIGMYNNYTDINGLAKLYGID